jgi:hypothetical protein
MLNVAVISAERGCILLFEDFVQLYCVFSCHGLPPVPWTHTLGFSAVMAVSETEIPFA